MKKLSCLLMMLSLVAFSSCKKEDVSESNISACGVKDPTKNVKWLKQLIEEEKKRWKGIPLMITIFDYKGETYLDCTSSASSCYLCNIYDCRGNRVFPGEIYTEDERAKFLAAASSGVLLWGDK